MEKEAYNDWKSSVLSSNKQTKPGLDSELFYLVHLGCV